MREGDIIRLASGNRYAKNVRHVVTQIIAPFGPPVSERPPLPSLGELQMRKDEKRAAKAERRVARAKDAMDAKREEKRLRRDKRAKPGGETSKANMGGSPDAESYGEGVRGDMVIENSGGLHHPGKIHDRAMANSQKAMAHAEKARRNEEDLKRTNERLDQMRIEGQETGKTGTEETRQEEEKTEHRARRWFGWR